MKDKIEKMLEYNRVFVEHEMYKQYKTTKYPDRKIAVLTCMDTRLIELLPAALGLRNGDVKMIKNAGAQVMHPFGSVMFSLIVAVYELGVDTILVVGHDDCGGQALHGDKIRKAMEEHGISREAIEEISINGKSVSQWMTGFGDVCHTVSNTVESIRNHPLIHQDVEVLGFIMNPETGALRSVE